MIARLVLLRIASNHIIDGQFSPGARQVRGLFFHVLDWNRPEIRFSVDGAGDRHRLGDRPSGHQPHHRTEFFAMSHPVLHGHEITLPVIRLYVNIHEVRCVQCRTELKRAPVDGLVWIDLRKVASRSAQPLPS